MDNCCLLNNDNKNKIKDYDYGLEKFELEDLNKSYRQYNIFSEYIDEYVIFVSSGNYKKTKNKYKASPDFAGIAMFFEISGKYDFILKYLTTDKDYANTLKKFSTTSDENEIRVCKVIERYVLGNNGFVNINEKESRFLYTDIQLKDYYVFENFVKIDEKENAEVNLIKYLNENEDLKNNRNNQQYIYIILKIFDLKSKKTNWLVCNRYRCCDYITGQSDIQTVLNEYADVNDSKKTTFNSNSSYCLFNNIESIYRNIDLTILVKEVLYKERKEFAYLDMPIWNIRNKGSFFSSIYGKPLTRNSLSFIDLIQRIKEYGIFLSYKRENNAIGVTNECANISNIIYDWLKCNDFVNIYRDVEDLNPGESIKDFMEEMSTNEYMIVCANQSYFESVDCMYELSRFFYNHKDNFVQKLFIISTFNIKKRQDDIKKFWSKKKAIDYAGKEREKFTFIKRNIKSLIDSISDIRFYVPNENFSHDDVAENIVRAICYNVL